MRVSDAGCDDEDKDKRKCDPERTSKYIRVVESFETGTPDERGADLRTSGYGTPRYTSIRI